MEKVEAATAEAVLSWPQSVGEFDALIEATQHRLVQFAFYRLHSLPDAEDVVQDVFVQAYRDRVRFRNVENVVPFLFRMVANRATDVLRKRRRSAGPPGEFATGPETGAGAGHQRWIEKLLERLPAKQAEAVRLRIYGELSFEAVAESAGCSVPTVKSRFRYGIQKLRKLLDRKGGNL